MLSLKQLWEKLVNRKQARLNLELGLAIRDGSTDEVIACLAAGADPNAFAIPGVNYLRPLAEAIKYDAPLEIVEALLKAGANPLGTLRVGCRTLLNSEIATLGGRSDALVRCLQTAERAAAAEQKKVQSDQRTTQTASRSHRFGWSS